MVARPLANIPISRLGSRRSASFSCRLPLAYQISSVSPFRIEDPHTLVSMHPVFDSKLTAGGPYMIGKFHMAASLANTGLRIISQIPPFFDAQNNSLHAPEEHLSWCSACFNMTAATFVDFRKLLDWVSCVACSRGIHSRVKKLTTHSKMSQRNGTISWPNPELRHPHLFIPKHYQGSIMDGTDIRFSSVGHHHILHWPGCMAVGLTAE